MLNSFEDVFRRQYPDCRVLEEVVSTALTRYRVAVGKIEFSESGVRDLAFKYALEEAAQLNIPPRVEQFELWPLRS